MMTERKHQLLFGPYEAPKTTPGEMIVCAVRGLVEVGGYTHGPIVWPRLKKTGSHAPIVCGDLIRALRQEAPSAVVHWWGVSWGTVCAWRKALGIVGQATPGTEQLRSDTFSNHISPEEAAKGREVALSPESIAKMSEAKAGRPAPPQTRAALLEAAKAPKSTGWKKKHAANMRRQWADGTRKNPDAWTEAEDRELESLVLEGLSDRAVAEKLGRTLTSVRGKRQALGIVRAAGKKVPSDRREHQRQSALRELLAEMNAIQKDKK